MKRYKVDQTNSSRTKHGIVIRYGAAGSIVVVI